MLESGVERALLSAGAEVSGLLRDDPAVVIVRAGGRCRCLAGVLRLARAHSGSPLWVPGV